MATDPAWEHLTRRLDRAWNPPVGVTVEAAPLVAHEVPSAIPATSGCVDKAFKHRLSQLRALVEQDVATFKGMPGREGGCYRAPINKWEDILNTVAGLLFSRAYE